MADAAQVWTWNYIKNVIPRTQGAMVQFSFYIRKRIFLLFILYHSLTRGILFLRKGSLLSAASRAHVIKITLFFAREVLGNFNAQAY